MTKLTKEQHDEMARVAAETLANMAAIAGPLLDAFRQMAQQAIHALAAAMNPFSEKLKELQIDADTVVNEMQRLKTEEASDEPR